MRRVGLALVLATIVAALLCAGARLGAQGDGGTVLLASLGQVERPTVQPLPRQWLAATVDGTNDASWLSAVRVDVVETSGVCIYLIRTRQREGDAAVRVEFLNKRDLLQGRGC